MGRLDKLPPYLFVAIDAAKRAALAAGVDVVDLGVGDPDLPTPAPLLDLMAESVRRPANHSYPVGRGELSLRRTIADWLERRHGVAVDPESQVLLLIGSKEGLGHLPLSCVEEGDNTLVPDVGYPVYSQATILAGGTPRCFPLPAAGGFLPDPQQVASLVDARTRLLFLNYPNNPTGASAAPELLGELAALSAHDGLTVINDAAYLEVAPAGQRAVSLLAVADHRRQRVVEFHSLSKMFNMTGWRIGFAVGHHEVISDLARVKETMDSGVFTAVQEVAGYALGEAFEPLLAGVLAPYPRRRRLLVEALTTAGIEVFPTDATFYVWSRVPAGEDSVSFCRRVLDELGVVVTPGVGFGPGGEGWFRISLTAADERIATAAERFGSL